MKQALPIQIIFDIKTIRKYVALLTGEYLSDEEIQEKYIDREPHIVDSEDILGEDEALKTCIGFLSICVAHNAMEKDFVYKTRKGKFQSKLEEMMKNQKDSR